MTNFSNMELEATINVKFDYITTLTEHLCNELGQNKETESEAIFAYMLREQVLELTKLKETVSDLLA